MAARGSTRRTGLTRAFETAYEGTPTWEIGRPQGAVIRLEEAGLIGASVLDSGCGTGDNALFLAQRGHAVLGIDFAPGAIAKAERKAAARELAARAAFAVHDALHLAGLGRSFDTLLDVGLFHTLQPGDREAYATALRAVIVPDGQCLLLAWSDRNPFGYGPERVRRQELRRAFATGWHVESIRDEELETLLPDGHVHAWLARMSPR